MTDEKYERFLSLAKEYGAEIRECEPGQGGVFVQGKRINSAKELFQASGFCPEDEDPDLTWCKDCESISNCPIQHEKDKKAGTWHEILGCTDLKHQQRNNHEQS